MAINHRANSWTNEREQVRVAFEQRDQVIKQLVDAVTELYARLGQIENAYMEDKLLGKANVSEENEQGKEVSLEDQAIPSSVSSVKIMP